MRVFPIYLYPERYVPGGDGYSPLSLRDRAVVGRLPCQLKAQLNNLELPIGLPGQPLKAITTYGPLESLRWRVRECIRTPLM